MKNTVMKRHLDTVAFLLIGVLLFLMFVSCNTGNKVFVDKNGSYFSSYEVKNNSVYIKYYIAITNQYDTEKEVTLSTKLPDDVTNGLLKKEDVKVLDEDGSEINFILAPKSTKSFDVVFVGDYAGTNQKHDRELPEIIVNIVE